MSDIVPVYSIAKTYTAIAACLTFGLDERIGQHVPELPPELAQLSMRDILLHRSGLNDYGSWSDYHEAVRNRDDPWPIETILARATVDSPGAFRYSNIGYLLLRRALENVHDDTYFGVLNAVALAPLGVTAYPFATREDWSVCTHPSINAELRRYHPGWVYTGTFAARVEDATRGIALIMQGKLGEGNASAMRDTLLLDAPGHPFNPAGYGLGLMTSGLPPTIVGHGGGGPGFSLFAACTADGERWHGAVSAREDAGTSIIQECADTLTDITTSPGS